jgi:hypothetical protein
MPPSNTVKEKVEQSVGVMAMDRQRRDQAINQLMGGIAANPVPQKMFSAAGGGLVSFAEGEEVEDEDFDTDKRARELYKLGLEQLKKRPESVKSPVELEEELRKKYPERFGVLSKPIGQEALAGLQALQAKQAQEDTRQQQELRDQRKMEFFKSLIAAGEATRGQKGIGGLFGGFGRSMLGAEEELGKQEAAIRGRGIKREADMLALRSEIEKAQRARAEGDVQGEIKHRQAAADLANKLGISQNALLRGMFQGVTTLAGRERSAEATEAAAKERGSRGGAGPRETVQDRQARALATQIMAENPGMSETEAMARAVRELKTQGPGVTAASMRATTEDMQAAEAEARRAVIQFMGKPEYDAKFTEAFNTALQRRLQSRQSQGLGSLPSGGAPTGAPAPGAPAPSTTPPANLLKKGVETEFANGQTWTLGADGQPKRVK